VVPGETWTPSGIFASRKPNNVSTSGGSSSMSRVISGSNSLTFLSSSRRRFWNERSVLMKYIYIYIYICVCVCVCVCARARVRACAYIYLNVSGNNRIINLKKYRHTLIYAYLVEHPVFT
jgi:hypothetical protein